MPRIIVNGKIKSISIIQILIFIFWTLIGVILSGPFHEFGHCVFYWAQGISAAMSLTKEFPLHDISVNQYALGSFGGIFFSWLAMVLFPNDKRSLTPRVLETITLATSYLLARPLPQIAFLTVLGA